MARFPTPLAQTVRRQHGVVGVAQLRAHHVSFETVERLRSRGTLSQPHPSVYCVGSHRHLGLEARCTVACLAHPGAVVCGAAAAALWGFDHVHRPHHPEVLVLPGEPDGRRVRGTAYRDCAHLHELRAVTRPDRVRVLDPAETWLDCVGELNTDVARVFTRHVAARHCAVDELLGAVERWESRRRRRPPGRARRLVAELTDEHLAVGA